MLTDERFGHQLGAQLRQELADVRAAPDLIVTLRRRRARRALAVRTAVAAPLVAAAAAAMLVTTADHGAPGGGSPTGGTRVELETVAQVQTQTLAALDRASTYVIYSRSGWTGEDGAPDGYYDTWVDRATQRYRNDVYDRSTVERPRGGDRATAPPPRSEVKLADIHLSQSHAASGPADNRVIVTLDHVLKTWSRSRDRGEPPPSATPDITDPVAVRKAIASGTVEMLGREKVAGRDTFHLRVYGPKRSYRIDMWVDSRSYLPVREAAAKGVDGKFPPSATVTTTYSWLPRTRENLARLVLTPPPGFTRAG